MGGSIFSANHTAFREKLYRKALLRTGRSRDDRVVVSQGMCGRGCRQALTQDRVVDCGDAVNHSINGVLVFETLSGCLAILRP